MAKKGQNKPSKKPQAKKAVTTKKVNAGVKKAAAPAAKATKVAAPAKKVAPQAKKPAPPTAKSPAAEKKTAPEPPEARKFFSVAEFTNMTYLTEYGVMQWLKQGLLKGRQNDKGDWQIDALNLEVPNVKRLVR